MMVTYVIRALFISAIPFSPNMIVVYSILIILSASNSFFTPSSITYTTMLIPKEKRKRFNAIRSLSTSGAIIVGPAIGGFLVLLTSVETTLLLNSIFFLKTSILLLILPEKESIDKKTIPLLSVYHDIHDLTTVWEFMIRNKYISFINLGSIIIMVFSFDMDAQDVVFIQWVIGLTE